MAANATASIEVRPGHVRCVSRHTGTRLWLGLGCLFVAFGLVLLLVDPPGEGTSAGLFFGLVSLIAGAAFVARLGFADTLFASPRGVTMSSTFLGWTYRRRDLPAERITGLDVVPVDDLPPLDRPWADLPMPDETSLAFVTGAKPVYWTGGVGIHKDIVGGLAGALRAILALD